MSGEIDWRQAVDAYASELRAAYGTRLDSVHLFGSRARGDAEPDSDIDLAVILVPPVALWSESERLCDLAYRHLLDDGVFIQPLAISRDEWVAETPDRPVIVAARRDAIRIPTPS